MIKCADSCLPDRDTILRLIANLSRFYRESAKPYLYAGRMIPAPAVDCGEVTFERQFSDRTVTLPAILSTAWEGEDGSRAQILINPTEAEAICTVEGKTLQIPALDAVLLPL